MPTRDVLVLSYAGCNTCKKALAWLQAHGIPHTLRPIVEQPPQPAELARWIPASGVTIRGWLNTSGQSYRALGKQKVEAASATEITRWLSADGKLVKRPVVVIDGGKRVLLGFKEDAFAAALVARPGRAVSGGSAG